jgi:hypothetical protein
MRSSVHGLRVARLSLEHLIVSITAVIIVVLFLLQRVGTTAVGRLLGPVMGLLRVRTKHPGARPSVPPPSNRLADASSQSFSQQRLDLDRGSRQPVASACARDGCALRSA